MNWKKDWHTNSLQDSWNIHTTPPASLELAEMRVFIQTLVDKILLQKQAAGTILADNGCTRPRNYEEFVQLVHFSFQKITIAWEHILREIGLDIDMPKIKILDSYDSRTAKFLWVQYTIDTETIHVSPFFLEYLAGKIYHWSEDFSLCYAIAHDFSHHIQKHLFESTKVTYLHNGALHEREINDILDLRVFALKDHFESAHQAEQIVELHADYLAWVAIHHANTLDPFLHENDIREWLETALHVGDDMIQFRRTGKVTPNTFTHGRCDQRVLAFAKWLETWNPLMFDFDDITTLFFKEGVMKYEDVSVTMFS